jgi:predicted ATPase
MSYIWVGLLLIGFSSGFGVATAISHNKIQRMSDGIAAQNREAELQYANLVDHANTTNKLLEANNATAIKTITDQRDAFRSKRMYDTHRKSSNCTTTNTTSTANTAADDGQLSNELTEFLKSEAYRADEISAYAELCQSYIKELAK